MVHQAQQAILLRVEQRLERLLVAQLVPAHDVHVSWMVAWLCQAVMTLTATLRVCDMVQSCPSCSPLVHDALLAVVAALVVCG
jgi:hypothetical protein